MNDTLSLKKTPLHALHLSLGARMVPFAGYDMPVQYPSGVLKEHLHTRANAGLFDVSHMGQIEIRAKSGIYADAALALETLVPVDVLGISPGRQRYGFFTSENGGILDDLMIVNRGDHLLVVVNAACKADDLAHLERHLGGSCAMTLRDDRALLALQGPRAQAVLGELWAGVADMAFMEVRDVVLRDVDCIVSRSGYSGEDGFEISLPADSAEDVAQALLGHPDCAPVGLGARDSLRLEAGLCLYGNDIDETTTPVEAGLVWAMQKVRRVSGAREGGFPGQTRIFDDLANGPARKRVGLRPDGKAPVRAGAALFSDGAGQTPAGHVTSGSFGPSVDGPVSMGYVATEFATPGKGLFADVRGKLLPVTVIALPFLPATYKR